MPDRRLMFLGAGLMASGCLFLFWGLTGRIAFILELRFVKLAGLVVVGAAIGTSAVLFQTLSGNRILTPSIMGFDALFLLLQVSLVLALGGFGYAYLPGVLQFGIDTFVMMAAAVVLFSAVLRRCRQDIQLMILVGVILSVMFRALTTFAQRLIDPSEFAMVQGAMFAQFSGINRTELVISVVLIALVFAWIAQRTAVLDVMALGRGPASSLGVNYERNQFGILCAIAVLVSVSTALVGPIVFLGLLVAALTYALMQTHQHALLLPAAGMIAACILVIGQAFFERLFRLQSTLAVVIEFFGGLLFLYFLARGRIK